MNKPLIDLSILETEPAEQYQSVLREVVGEYVPVYLIGVEKVEPFRCGVWLVSDDTLFAAIDLFVFCS